MKHVEEYDVIVVNRATKETTLLGSVSTDNPNEILKKGLGKNWAAVYNRLLNLINTCDFTKLTLKLMFFMTLNMTYGNYLRNSQKDMAEYYNVSEALISRSIAELKDADFCIKYFDKNNTPVFMINPEFVHKGKQRKTTFEIYAERSEAVKKMNRKEKSAETGSTQNTSSDNFNLNDSESKEFKAFNKNKVVKMLKFFVKNFEKSVIITKTLDEISESIDVSKVTLIKFVRVLEKFGYISKKRGKFHLITNFNQLHKLLKYFVGDS